MDNNVSIIGASSSGLYAAELLAKSGKKVDVFDRAEEVDPPRRTYIITTGVKQVMNEFPTDEVNHVITKMAVETKHEETNIKLNKPDLIIERNQLRKSLAERARRAGATFHLGKDFVDFKLIGKRLNLVFEDHNKKQEIVPADTVIGADGAFSKVAQAAGIIRPPTVPLIQAEIQLPSGWNPYLTKVWFDVSATRYFYWLIPESRSRAVVGLISEQGRDIRSLLTRFLEQHSYHPLNMQSGQAAMHHPSLRPWGRVGDADVLLIGDAAGQVKVTTVGGTVTGFWGGTSSNRSNYK